MMEHMIIFIMILHVQIIDMIAMEIYITPIEPATLFQNLILVIHTVTQAVAVVRFIKQKNFPILFTPKAIS